VRSWIDYSGEVVWDPSLPLITQLLGLGVGLSVTCVAVTVFVLRRRGWNSRLRARRERLAARPPALAA
jgi:hypothetical protein